MSEQAEPGGDAEQYISCMSNTATVKTRHISLENYETRSIDNPQKCQTTMP
jgi:hypothetical protein